MVVMRRGEGRARWVAAVVAERRRLGVSTRRRQRRPRGAVCGNDGGEEYSLFWAAMVAADGCGSDVTRRVGEAK